MRPLLVVLLFTGAGLLVLHQSLKTQAAIEQKIEYRYLPLPLDQWLKEQQFSAFNVMNDMIETTQGYCGPVKTSSVTPTTAPPQDTLPPTTPSPTPTMAPLVKWY